MNRRVVAAADAEELNQLAGAVLIDVTARAIFERDRAVILVSGGTSVRRAYDLFGKADNIDWSKVYIFWGDDRFVEPANPYSNYGLVRDTILANAKELPEDNVFPIDSNADTPTGCAAQYSRAIADFFRLKPGEWPVFDLAQNGMGADGHTASLFPHSPAVEVADKIAVMQHAALKPWIDRITLTLPVFNHARTVVFITSGPTKTTTLKTILEGSPTAQEMPAASIKPENGSVLWLVDKAAAAALTVPPETNY